MEKDKINADMHARRESLDIDRRRLELDERRHKEEFKRCKVDADFLEMSHKVTVALVEALTEFKNTA